MTSVVFVEIGGVRVGARVSWMSRGRGRLSGEVIAHGTDRHGSFATVRIHEPEAHTIPISAGQIVEVDLAEPPVTP